MSFNIINVHVAASGDNTLITGVAGKRIYVMAFELSTATATVVKFYDGPSSNNLLLATYDLPVAVSVFPMQDDATSFPLLRSYFITSAGNNLVVNLSAANSVDGRMSYIIR